MGGGGCGWEDEGSEWEEGVGGRPGEGVVGEGCGWEGKGREWEEGVDGRVGGGREWGGGCG